MKSLRVPTRRGMLALGVGVLAGLATLAPRAARAADTADAAAPIAALNDSLIASMKAGSDHASFAQRVQSLTPVVTRVFDLPAILQACVGPRWSSLPEAQQEQLRAAFEQFTVATYAASFASFSGERFDVQPDTRPVGADQVVQTRLTPAGGDPVRIDYQMRQEDGAWRVVDVLLEGSISRVAVQRSDFRSLLAQGDAAALIDNLQRKVAELSGGAPPG